MKEVNQRKDERKDIIYLKNLFRQAVIDMYPDFIQAVNKIKGCNKHPIKKPLKK